MALTPIQVVGGTALLRVAERDFVGVEANPTGLTDHRGVNEGFDWTKRAGDIFQIEHDAYGLHDTLRVARAVLLLTYDGSAYTVHAPSYLQNTTGTVVRGSACVAAIATPGAGQVGITLAAALPSTSYLVKDLTGCVDWTTEVMEQVNVNLLSITSTTVFSVTRWAGTSFSTATQAHGRIAVGVYGV